MTKKTYKTILFSFAITILTLTCTGCTSQDTPMPYSSSDYENGEWTLEEIVKNLEELGFDDIDVEKSESRFVTEEYIEVKVEDFTSDSFFTEYTDFVAGEPLNSWRKVQIKFTKPIPVLSINNCPELTSYLAKSSGSESEIEEYKTFIRKHVGEYIEFNGYVTEVYDEVWYAAGIDITVSIEGFENVTVHWESIEPNTIGYDNDYSYGCIPDGTPVYGVAKIVYEGNDVVFKGESIKIIR